MANSDDIVNLVINPPIQSQVQTSIQITLTLETIWNYCNRVVHSDTKPNLITIIKSVERRILEHVDVATPKVHVINKVVDCWKKPLHDTVKLNTDAALLGNEAILAVVARDDSGVIIMAATKKMFTEDPAVAEASTMLWALQLAESHHFQHCIIEGDANNCLDACIGKLDDCPWALFAIFHDVKFLLPNFTSVDFIWVRRKANLVAHALAKFASQSQVFTFSNIDSLPPSVYEA